MQATEIINLDKMKFMDYKLKVQLKMNSKQKQRLTALELELLPELKNFQ